MRKVVKCNKMQNKLMHKKRYISRWNVIFQKSNFSQIFFKFKMNVKPYVYLKKIYKFSELKVFLICSRISTAVDLCFDLPERQYFAH